MRVFVLGAIFLTAACGKVVVSSKLGEERTFAPLSVSQTDVARMNQLCSALNRKTTNIGQGAWQNVTFAVSSRNCDQPQLSPSVDVQVMLEMVPPQYRLKRVDNGTPFVYPDLETTQSGTMQEICGALGSLKSPMMLSNGNAIWFSTANNSECQAGNKEICLKIETGLPVESRFKIVSNEWTKFNTDLTHARAGYFLDKKTISSSHCTSNDTAEIRANLK